jgi:hypothetical protein
VATVGSAFRVTRQLSAGAASLFCVLALTPVASVARLASTNWAGYAVHGNKDHFRQVIGSWNEPKLVCKRGQKTYVTIWAGLGGFAPASIATEQIGTEGDCTANGKQVSYAWYQLTPGPHNPISMRIKPGDAMRAVVTLGHGTVTLELANHTHPQLYAQTFADAFVDDSAADWIVQARPFCLVTAACSPLPLANFRYVCFGNTTAELANGHVGAISDPAWQATAVSIGRHGHRFGVLPHASDSPLVGGASPSPLNCAGSTFTVNYRSLSVGGNPFL